MLKSIEKVCFEYELHIEKQEGEDFLFLFDLLAHTSGTRESGFWTLDVGRLEAFFI